MKYTRGCISGRQCRKWQFAAPNRRVSQVFRIEPGNINLHFD